jgi:hypothetical protein
MSKKTPNEDNTVILSDKYLSESGVQGGKIIAEHLALGCFLVGTPLFIIGLFSLLVFGVPQDMPIILILLSPPSLVMIIGVSLIIGGCFMYRDTHTKKITETH